MSVKFYFVCTIQRISFPFFSKDFIWQIYKDFLLHVTFNLKNQQVKTNKRHWSIRKYIKPIFVIHNQSRINDNASFVRYMFEQDIFVRKYC